MKLAITKMSMIYLTGVLLFFAAIFSNTTWAGEDKDSLPRNHLALFIGLAAETNRDTPDENTYAVGLEYKLRFRISVIDSFPQFRFHFISNETRLYPFLSRVLNDYPVL